MGTVIALGPVEDGGGRVVELSASELFLDMDNFGEFGSCVQPAKPLALGQSQRDVILRIPFPDAEVTK
jgi:hypothetical protein